MTKTLQDTTPFEWQEQFEKRAMAANTWVIQSAKKLPLQQRRALIQRIQDGMDEAAVHRDISYGAKQICHSLVHALWDSIHNAPTPRQATVAKKNIEDFSVWVATDAPAHKAEIQRMFWRIVPEDMPLIQKPLHKIAEELSKRGEH